MTDHQQNQIAVINEIEEQVKSNSVQFSTVPPVLDYKNDPRICLSSVHLLSSHLSEMIQSTLIEPLKSIAPDFYYYPSNALHMTIKGIRNIHNPPNFTNEDISKVEDVLSSTLSHHKRFTVYFYRLLLFQSNLALIGTTDQELDNIVIELDGKLKKAGVPDDKVYTNSQYFFSNVTLLRFNGNITEEFKIKVDELSKKINFEPYTVDSVSLVTGNAVLSECRVIKEWRLP